MWRTARGEAASLMKGGVEGGGEEEREARRAGGYVEGLWVGCVCEGRERDG